MTIEGREYSLQERQNLIHAHSNQEIGTAELHILQEEVQIYEGHWAEGYLAEYALDVDRLGVGLSSMVEGYYRENKRPFPNRPEDSVNIPTIEWGAIESQMRPDEKTKEEVQIPDTSEGKSNGSTSSFLASNTNEKVGPSRWSLDGHYSSQFEGARQFQWNRETIRKLDQSSDLK